MVMSDAFLLLGDCRSYRLNRPDRPGEKSLRGTTVMGHVPARTGTDRLLIRPTWWAGGAGRFTTVNGQVSARTPTTGRSSGQASRGSRTRRRTSRLTLPASPRPAATNLHSLETPAGGRGIVSGRGLGGDGDGVCDGFRRLPVRGRALVEVRGAPAPSLETPAGGPRHRGWSRPFAATGTGTPWLRLLPAPAAGGRRSSPDERPRNLYLRVSPDPLNHPVFGAGLSVVAD